MTKTLTTAPQSWQLLDFGSKEKIVEDVDIYSSVILVVGSFKG